MPATPDAQCIGRTLRYFETLLAEIAQHQDSDEFIEGSFENLWESVQKSLTARNSHSASSMPKDRIPDRTSEIMDLLLDAHPNDPGTPDFFLAYMEYDRVAANNLFEVLNQFESPQHAGDFLRFIKSAAEGLGDPTNLQSQPYYEGLQTLCRSCSGNLGIKGTWYQMEVVKDAVGASGGAGWRHVEGIEVFEPAGDNLARGIDLVLDANHPGFPGGRAGGRLLEVKSGPSLVPNQVARHFSNHPSAAEVTQVRFVINASGAGEVSAAAGDLWSGISKVFHGGDGITADAALARRILRDAGINFPAGTNVGDVLLGPGNNHFDVLARAFIINNPKRIPLKNP